MLYCKSQNKSDILLLRLKNMFIQLKKLSVLGLLALGLLLIVPNVSVAANYTFVEDFHSRKYEDVRKTTAFWDTEGGSVSLQPIDISSVRVDSPGDAVYQIIPCGSYWIFDAGLQVFAYNGTTVSNLTPVIYGGVATVPGIACGKNNVSYFHYTAYDPITGGSQVFQQYDGTSVTTVPLDFSFASRTWLNQLSLSSETINGNLFFSTPAGDLYMFDGTNVTKIIKVTKESDLGEGNFGLVHFYPGGLYKVVGQKAYDLTAQTGMLSVTDVSKIDDIWYIGGRPGPDEYRSQFPNGFLEYDGTKFTDLTTLAPNGAQEVAGHNKKMLALLGGSIYRFNGKSAKLYYSPQPNAGSYNTLGWNGYYWLVGGFLSLNGYNGLYRIDPKQSDTDTAQSLTIDKTKDQIRSASLLVTDSIAGKISVSSTSIKPLTKPKIIYYLSNNGGKNWQKVTLGKKTKFTTTGSDLRWKVVMVRGSKESNVSITRISIKY